MSFEMDENEIELRMENIDISSTSDYSSSLWKTRSFRDNLNLLPYNFHTTDANGSLIQLDPANAKYTNVCCPDFSALLDHALAVIWIIYSKSRNDLSPTQILWAIRFLEGMKNKCGQTSNDVQAAISKLESIIHLKYNRKDEKVLTNRSKIANVDSDNEEFFQSKNAISFTLHDIYDATFMEVIKETVK